MNNCDFVSVLHKLRKSSKDSIDDIDSFSPFKDYMHIKRKVEYDLKKLLKNVNKSGKKTLILLCGSAGDGKSHLLSFLKNNDDEKLLENYKRVHNDATESINPKKTSLDSLNEILSDFSDEKLENDEENCNAIVAINLGVLSNFIKSEYGKKFEKLKEYVAEKKILTEQIDDRTYNPDSYFQHISFSDYHMYKLTKGVVDPDYILKIFGKVFDEDERNEFRKSYDDKCCNCDRKKECPVKHNYEYLMNFSVRESIANILIKTTIVDKTVLTTRDLFDYIYNIIVPQDFDFDKIS